MEGKGEAGKVKAVSVEEGGIVAAPCTRTALADVQADGLRSSSRFMMSRLYNACHFTGLIKSCYDVVYRLINCREAVQQPMSIPIFILLPQIQLMQGLIASYSELSRSNLYSMYRQACCMGSPLKKMHRRDAPFVDQNNRIHGSRRVRTRKCH